jgi:hypothetical protein
MIYVLILANFVFHKLIWSHCSLHCISRKSAVSTISAACHEARKPIFDRFCGQIIFQRNFEKGFCPNYRLFFSVASHPPQEQKIVGSNPARMYGFADSILCNALICNLICIVKVCYLSEKYCHHFLLYVWCHLHMHICGSRLHTYIIPFDQFKRGNLKLFRPQNRWRSNIPF